MAFLQIRIDEDLKNKANAVYSAIGVDLSTAVRIFLKKSIQEGGFPFDTRLNESFLKAVLAVERMQTDSEHNGNSKMTLKEINDEIKLARNNRKK